MKLPPRCSLTLIRRKCSFYTQMYFGIKYRWHLQVHMRLYLKLETRQARMLHIRPITTSIEILKVAMALLWPLGTFLALFPSIYCRHIQCSAHCSSIDVCQFSCANLVFSRLWSDVCTVHRTHPQQVNPQQTISSN